MPQVSKALDKVEFGLLPPEEIRDMSVARIVTADTYDEDGYPIEKGLMDPRLGVIDPGLRCRTCGKRSGVCPGHFGRIELARPVIHVGFARTVYSLIRATCRKCGRIMLSEDKLERYRDKLRESEGLSQSWKDYSKRIVRRAYKRDECPHCGAGQEKIKFEKPTTHYEGDKRLTPSDVRRRLEDIPDSDVRLLGLNPEVARPEWMVLTVLPVPPVTVRPSITLETGVRSEDDLTHKLVDVIRINQRLSENLEAGAPHLIIEDLWELLQYHVTTFFTNEVSGIPPARHRSGRNLRTLAQRLKGKEGRFRGNLSGKRVDFSARTVISPDPQISINEIGVPEYIARNLTIPVQITQYNIEEARNLIRRGPDIHPGATSLKSPDGNRFDLRYADREELAKMVEPGYEIERHLKDKDIVLFNRQPSLHRMSIMAHEVKVMPGQTFRLNLSVCVTPDTKVLSGGAQHRIGEMKNHWKNSRVKTFDLKNRKSKLTGLKSFWKLDPEEYGKRCYKIKTDLGREITTTSDHPFYTEKGKLSAEEIEVGDRVMVYPTEFPEHTPQDEQILSKRDVIENAPKETYLKHCIKVLEERKLLPLEMDKSLILAKLIGHLFGDGTFVLNKDESRAVFRGREEDLKDIQEDIEFLGFKSERIRSKSSEGMIRTSQGKTIKVEGEGKSFELRSKPFGVLLAALGAPNGDKVSTEYSVPDWIVNAPKSVKKEFLAAYFGCELSKPKVRKKCGKLFKDPIFKISKIEEKSNVALRFIGDLKKLLREFEVEIVSTSKEEGNIRRSGRKTVSFQNRIASNLESLINLFGKIGYAYHEEKESLARLAYQYLKIKKREIEKRRNIYKKTVSAEKGEIKEIAETHGVSTNLLYKWRWSHKKHGKINVGLGNDFSDFEEWKKEFGLENGLVYEKVKVKSEVEVESVLDLTTQAETHNFVANGFLTGNCPPYNADFDGDEMNLHLPQSKEAQAEAKTLMKVQEQILSPRFGAPIIGGIQDHITGLYLLTQRGFFLNREEAQQILAATGKDPDLPEPSGVEDGEECWLGKKIFSMFLPDGLDLTYKANICDKGGDCHECDRWVEDRCEIDARVKIRDGELEEGVIDSASYEALSDCKVLDRIVKDYGTDAAREFLDETTKLAIAVIQRFGFTTSLSDEEIPEEARGQIQDVLEDARERVQELIEVYRRGELEQLPGRTLRETLEMRIMELLAETRDKTGEIAEDHLGLDNDAVVMARTGARGSMLNLTQMTGCVGQQSVRGERPSRGYEGRALSHFKAGDLSGKARGFASSSYKDGLDPTEFFFHAMGGREGLVDTAVRTAQSGYMQRRLINALQDLRVEHDGTVRDDHGNIVQFEYGEDSVDPARSDKGEAVDVDQIIEDVMAGE